ncbi:hypothetical protein LUZ60_003311 [Juncus effusus]|nr:hypothetical protein LUZ60_003311 [Juncus effusus]
MISLRTIRRICVAIDAFAITCIAAGISKSVTKRDFAAYSHSSNHPPENFPTIASCKAALLKNQTNSKSTTPKSDRNDPSPQEITKEPALFQLKKEKNPEKLFSIFQSNAQNRFVVENRFVFEDTVSRLAGAKRFDLIEEILENQKSLPQGKREGFIIRIITLYGRACMSNHAIKTFREMHLFGCKRTVKSFNATLKVLSQAGRYDELCFFFTEAPEKYEIQMDEISYNTLIKIMCERQDLELAYKVMKEMGKLGIKPDVVTYTTLISAFYKNDRREIADGLWNLMRLRGINPNLATYNVRIQYLIHHSRTFEANNLVRSMYNCGIKPDEVTYNLIIKGFFMMGESQMAKNVFYAINRRDCDLNERIYQTMIHYLCEEREFELGFRLCKKSIEKNWYPSVDTIRKLMKGLMAVKKERNASEIMKLVVKRGKKYSIDELVVFRRILNCRRKEGEN